jgi:tRNA (guanosine-2'-O-)-methyltransferase
MNDKATLIEQLLPYITDNKRTKMLEVVENRTQYVTILLEDLFQPHNASAALRTCDIFGIQDVHVVETNYKFKAVDTISMGSTKWVDTYPHPSINDAIKHLKNNGYRIVATSPHQQSYSLPDLPLDHKTALLFGSEQLGLSKEALDLADEYVKIPMFGFVESFNVSVSVALCLYDIMTRLHRSSYPWKLSETEKQDLLIKWICKTSKTAELIAKQKKGNC